MDVGWNRKTVESDMERSTRRLASLSPPAANAPKSWAAMLVRRRTGPLRRRRNDAQRALTVLSVRTSRIVTMSFRAIAVRVMIASPSDVPAARDSVERALHDWNQTNAHNRGIVLMPWRWESSSVPMMGVPAQGTINAQGLDQADIVFVLFGTKLGTETETALSGTVEELVRASEQGKPVHVYFSQEPVDPGSIDIEQLNSLRAYKSSLEGLYSEFANESELVVHVWRAVEHDLGVLNLESTPSSGGGTAVEDVAWSLDHKRERELTGYSKQGKPQYTTRHELVVTNRGKSTATGVTFAAAPEGTSMHLGVGSNPTDIYPGQSKTLPVMFTLGGAEPKLCISWIENGEPQSAELFVN